MVRRRVVQPTQDRRPAALTRRSVASAGAAPSVGAAKPSVHPSPSSSSSVRGSAAGRRCRSARRRRPTPAPVPAPPTRRPPAGTEGVDARYLAGEDARRVHQAARLAPQQAGRGRRAVVLCRRPSDQPSASGIGLCRDTRACSLLHHVGVAPLKPTAVTSRACSTAPAGTPGTGLPVLDAPGAARQRTARRSSCAQQDVALQVRRHAGPQRVRPGLPQHRLETEEDAGPPAGGDLPRRAAVRVAHRRRPAHARMRRASTPQVRLCLLARPVEGHIETHRLPSSRSMPDASVDTV